MPLYDVTNHTPKLVKPQDSESYEVIQKAKKEVGSLRFKKDCDISDVAIDSVIDKAKAGNKLAFLKAGIVFGQSSQLCTVKDYNHIWDTAEIAYPTTGTTGRQRDLLGEYQLRFVGGLLRWRVALQDDTWLVYRRDSGTFNKYTGEEIKISEYWINNNFVPRKK
jgi:hypothetical protein